MVGGGVRYTRFPHKAALLCRAFNAEYRLACLDFIHVPIDQLDIGFSSELKHTMEAAGDTESAQVAYLLSDAVQQALETAFRAAAASSLPVERAFAQTKRNGAP